MRAGQWARASPNRTVDSSRSPPLAAQLTAGGDGDRGVGGLMSSQQADGHLAQLLPLAANFLAVVQAAAPIL